MTSAGLLLIASVLVAPLAPVAAQQDTVPPPPTATPAARPVESAAVIPAGKEEVLAVMLGKGAALPEGCELSNGDTNGRVLRATYTCTAGTVVLELHHPSDAPADAKRTAKFALLVSSGSPPPGLIDAIVRLIDAREAEFDWVILVPPTPAPTVPAAPAAQSTETAPGRISLIAGAVLVIVVVAAVWLLRRRRAPPR